LDGSTSNRPCIECLPLRWTAFFKNELRSQGV
jgi:hypothetical protein